jgi:general secretion pathway protein D
MTHRRARSRMVLLAMAGLALATAAPAQTGSTSYVNFSFDQVDIRLLVKLVGDMTGKRFVIDNAVAGKVTVVTPPQIPADEVYPLFLSILESTGYSVLEKEGAFHVVALPERAISPAPVVGPGDTTVREGLITKVIRVSNISVLDLRKVLEPMVRGGKAGALAAFGPTNHLIITDTAENVARIEKLIAELDKPGAAREIEVIRLAHASADDLAKQVQAAISGSASGNQTLGRHIQQVAEGAGALPGDIVIVAAPSINSVVVAGTPVQLGEIKRVVEMMDVESESGYGRLNAIFLKYLSAEEAAKTLNALLAKTVEKDQRQRIALEPNAARNALVVDASPQDFALVQKLVAQLDEVPQQVMVEILIAEVGLDKNLDFGVEWSTIESPESGKDTILGRSLLGGTDNTADATKGIFSQGLTFGISHGTFVDSAGNIQPRIPFLVKALAENRDVKILSSIPLRAQNNTEASVSVVENIPILRSTIEGGSGTARDVIQNIDRVDVGIKLKLTPHVNPDRQITLQLNPSIEAIVDQGPADTQFAPTIAKREVSTTVTVADKATIIISGLIREDDVKVVAKVPVLGDIPLLGMLFRNTTTRRQRTNLLIFVTPHIVTDLVDADALGETLKDRAGMDVTPTNLTVRPSKRK